MTRLYLLGLLGLILLTAGCGHMVAVPPEINLKNYEPLGIVVFTGNAQGNLNRVVTQRVLEAITKDQKMVRIIELGREADVLKEIGVSKWGPEAVKKIGGKYVINTVIVGTLDVSKVKPHVNLGPGIVGVTADVQARLTVCLQETETGATIWSNSAMAEQNVGEVSLVGGDWLNFDARDPDLAYGDLAHELAYRATRDFRVTYRRE